MKKTAALSACALLLSLLAASCYRPYYPADLDTVTLNLTIGQTTPADIIAVLGEPASRGSESGYDTYTFTSGLSVIRVFVDHPGGDMDRVIMIDGADDSLHATFFEGRLTSAY